MTATITPVTIQISEREARELVALIQHAKATGYCEGTVGGDDIVTDLGFAETSIIDATVKNFARTLGTTPTEANYIKAHMRGHHGATFNHYCPMCE
jgi:hypothetical protein